MGPEAGERLPLNVQSSAGLVGGKTTAKKMHPGYAMVFALNYMMGSGFLTLPRAFVDAGVGMGCVLTVLIAFGATVSAECLLDVMARARKEVASHGLPADAGSFYRAPLEELPVARGVVASASTRERGEAQRFAQVSDLCSLYLGVGGNAAYNFMLVCFMYGSLWAYAAIFGASFAAHGVGDIGYRAYVLMFGAVVAPLACRDLAEQKRLQSALAIGRTAMLALMVATALTALLAQGPEAPMPLEEKTVGYATRLVAAAPIVAFACTCHHSVPQISAPVDVSSRGPFTLNLVFRYAFSAAAVVYLIFAVVIARFFGARTQSAVNLDWANYAVDSRSQIVRTLGSFVGKFVVVYPAVNVVSAYPLSAITLGDALMAAYRQYLVPKAPGQSLRPHSSRGCLSRFLSNFTMSPTASPLFSPSLAAAARRRREQQSKPVSGGVSDDDDDDDALVVGGGGGKKKKLPTSKGAVKFADRPTLADLELNDLVARRAPADDVSAVVRAHAPPSLTQKVFFRLVAALPPIAGALCADDISTITRFTGSFGLAMCAAIPGLLALVARRHLPGDTPHASSLNTQRAAFCLLIVGLVLALTPVLSAGSDKLDHRAHLIPDHDDSVHDDGGPL